MSLESVLEYPEMKAYWDSLSEQEQKDLLEKAEECTREVIFKIFRKLQLDALMDAGFAPIEMVRYLLDEEKKVKRNKPSKTVCEKCGGEIDVIPESQASAILKCKECGHKWVILF